MRATIVAALSIMTAACQGANEKAGEAQDRAAANATGVAYNDDGPAERAGRDLDRTQRAADKARDSAAREVEARQNQIKVTADVDADRLDQQADEIRRTAKQKADALKAQEP